MACININIRSTIVRAVFEGIRGGSYFGDIAIDDVTLERGRCSGLTQSRKTHFYFTYKQYEAQKQTGQTGSSNKFQNKVMVPIGLHKSMCANKRSLCKFAF